nr:MAG: hypothetical protein [Microvirus sp.]
MSKINDALVSVVVELILMVPKLVKGIAKRYKVLKSKRVSKSELEQIEQENDK